jgi:WD40 repeat protein
VAASAGHLLRDGNQFDGTNSRPRVSRQGRVAAPGADGTILVASVDGAAPLTLRAHEGAAREVAWAPDGLRLASIGADRALRVWDVQAGTSTTLATLASQGFRLRWSPDSRWIAVTEGFETLDVFDVATGKLACAFKGHANTAADFTADGARIAFVDVTTVKIGDPATCQARPAWSHKAKIFGFAFTPDGKMATASADGTIAYGDVFGTEPRRLEGHDAGAYSVAISPDGRTLASGDFDGFVRTWDTATGAAKRVIQAHDKAVLYLAFLPGHDALVSGAPNDVVRVWDVGSGELVHEERGTGAGGFGVAPDGAWIASAGPRGVRAWPADLRAPMPRDEAGLRAWMAVATHTRIDAKHRAATP